jgi:hypothetical protein
MTETDTLVKRLRFISIMIRMGERISWGADSTLMDEAVATLDAQTEEIRSLREALGEIAAHEPTNRDFSGPTDAWTYCRDRARKALTP